MGIMWQVAGDRWQGKLKLKSVAVAQKAQKVRY